MKVAVICPDAFTAWQFHRTLLVALVQRGHEVCVISPPVRADDVQRLQALGVGHIPIHFERFVSPLADLAFLIRLVHLLRTRRFDCVHSFNLKVHIYGTLAARLAGVPMIFGTIEGLGFAYTEPRGIRRKLLLHALDALNALACRVANKVWFVNADDLQFLVDRHVIAREKGVVIKGCGVDLAEFSAAHLDSEAVHRLQAELDLGAETPCVTMAVARAVWSKGVREFVEAADQLAATHPLTRFVLLAPIEAESPQAVPPNYLRAAEARNPQFRWLSTFRRDVREILSVSSVFTLPSYYREGLPKVLMEAMAMGMPIVTTNNVGCRDAVDDRGNGFLVPVKDSRALADALGTLLADADLRARFGAHSRVKVAEFSDTRVVGRVLAELYGTN